MTWNSWRPVGDIAFQDSCEHFIDGSRIFTVDLVHQLFGIFSSGVSVGRTWTFGHGQILFSSETDDIRLGHIKQRPDDSKAGSFEPGNWWECIEVTFINQRHQHGFNQIVTVMSVSDFIATMGSFPQVIKIIGPISALGYYSIMNI